MPVIKLPPVSLHLLVAIAVLLAAPSGNSASSTPFPTFTSTSAAISGPASEPRPKPALSTPLGANLPAISDYSRTPVYVDLLHQARRFGTPAAPWDEKALLDDDGWPIGDFGVFLMTGQAEVSEIAGIYRLSFNGRANVGVVASKATLRNQRYDPVSNLTTLELELPEHADQLALSFTQTGAGIRNLKVIRPGYDAANPPLFTTRFLDHLARFTTLRFMDWLRTNNNDRVTSWATRASPARTHHASPAGVPWEHIVALANQTGKDVWINIPVKADDDYVLQLARLLQSSLNPEASIYIEYSNELWNAQFGQFHTNVKLAIAEVRDNPASPLAYDGSTDQNQWGYRRIAKRLKEISDLFRNVYGDAAMMRTVRPVFASQVVQPYVTEVGLKFIEAVHGPPANYFYAVAGAPYFNLGDQQTVDGLTPDQVLQAMDTSVSRLPNINQFEKNVALASWYGLPFIAYEGGSDTFGPGGIDAKKAASLDPRLQAICNRYLNTWYENGGALFMWFTAGAGNWDTQYGAWELTTDLSITDTPKIKCLDAALAAPIPALQGRNTIPGSFDALAYVGNQPPYSEDSTHRVRYLHPGMSVDYLVLAPKSGMYSLVLNAAAERAGNTVDVAVNAKTVGRGFELKASGWSNPVDNTSLTLRLSRGFNTLRLTTRTETSGYWLSQLTIH